MDFLRHEVRAENRLLETLQRQAVAGAERQYVVLERRRGDDARAGKPLIGVELYDRDFEILLEELPQARQLHRVAKCENLVDVGGLLHVHREVSQRRLHFRHQIAVHRPHRLEQRLRVVRSDRLRVALEMLGLAERGFERLGNRLGKVIAAQGDAALPDAIAVRQHNIGSVGADRHDHFPRRRIVGIDGRGNLSL